MLFALVACGCVSSPPPITPRAKDLEARLPALAERLAELRGERLKVLPQVERWTRGEFRRYLLTRWEREWPADQAALEGRVLVTLGLWAAGLDYRAETLALTVADTNAAYLEDRDTIVVLMADPVPDRTLVHELVHALQQQRWGSLATPQTFAGLYDQTAAVEGEAVAAEALFAGDVARLRALPRSRPFPTKGQPAWHWLGVDAILAGASAAASEERPGERSLPPSDPRPEAGCVLGPARAGDQIMGKRGVAWWVALWAPGFPTILRGDSSEGWINDRLRVSGDWLEWKIECTGEQQAKGLAAYLAGKRPGLDVSSEGRVFKLRLPLK